MNVNSVQNTQNVQSTQVNQNMLASALQGGDFMTIIQQIMSQSNQSQKNDALMLLTGKQETDENVNDELMKLLTQFSASMTLAPTDTNQLIELLKGNTDVQSSILSSVAGENLQDGNSNQLLQLLGGQTESDSNISAMLTDNQNVNSMELILKTLSGNNDTDQSSTLNQLITNLNGMSASSTESSNLLSQLLGSDTSSSNLSAMLGSFETENDDGAISLAGAIPLNALYELAKINSKKNDSSEVSNEVESNDFSQMSTGEKIQALKTALINGDVTVDKDTDIVDVINQLSSNYKLADSVTKAKQAIESDTTDNQPDMLAAGVEKTYDYSEISVLNNSGNVDESAQILTQTADSIARAVSDDVEKFSVKLNPAGLGEIVVKMEKSADGIVVDMVASSSKTAEILNTQLNNLQASLSHYNAQVNPAVVTAPTSESSANNSFAFSQQMADQGFANQSQQNSQNNYYHNYQSSDDAVSQAAEKLAENGALNVYA